MQTDVSVGLGRNKELCTLTPSAHSCLQGGAPAIQDIL